MEKMSKIKQIILVPYVFVSLFSIFVFTLRYTNGKWFINLITVSIMGAPFFFLTDSDKEELFKFSFLYIRPSTISF